jgi:hypothetical protein
MLNEKEVDRLNNFLKGKTFPYKRGIFDYDLPGENDFDFKFQILGYKKMISVGEYYDYTIVSVTLLNFRDELSQMLFLRRLNGDFLKKYFKENMYYFRNNLNTEIRDILKVFDEDARVTIQDIDIETPKGKETLQEQNTMRQPLRDIVKNIVGVFKNNDEGEFTLPEDLNPDELVYDIGKVGSPFNIELTIEPDETIKTVVVDGNYWGDDDTIEIIIKYNLNVKSKIIYELVGKLNETLAHEIRHIIQSNKGIFDLDVPEEKDPYKYYTQPHELDALKFGFKRLAKLRKIPLKVAVQDWFDNHKEIHRLKDNQVGDVISKIINY